MNWFTTYAFGSPAADWFACGIILLLFLALCIGYKTVSRMITDKREEDESEKEYWRIHGGE